jgi:hypothetical protein
MTTTNRRLLAFDSVDSDSGRDNAEVFARFRSNGMSLDSQFYLTVRGSGSAATEGGYVFKNNSATSISIIKFVSGTATTLATVTVPTMPNDTYLGLRFRVNGTSLKAKVWNSQIDPEPAAWNIDITDASITGTGYAGIGNNTSFVAQRWDDVAFGTSGDTAVFATSADVRETQDTALVPGAGPGAIRSTQLAALALGGVAPNIRETQLCLLVLGVPLSPMRVTQFAALPFVAVHADIPVTQMTALVLSEYVPCTTQWAETWTITRTDGQVFAYTSLDRPLLFRGVVHSPCNSLSATATEQSTTIGASGNMELLGIISDAGISEQELYNGLFDFARFEVWCVPWNSTSGETPFRLMASVRLCCLLVMTVAGCMW